MSQCFAMLLSIVTEAAVGAILLALLRWGRPHRGALAAALGTVVTHWPAWWSMAALDPVVGYTSAMLAIESAVVGVESIAYLVLVPLPFGRALVASLLANAVSAGLGLALYALNLA
jgi:hypothetical protein